MSDIPPGSVNEYQRKLGSKRVFTVVSRMVTFLDGFFPERHFRKVVSRMVIFPDETISYDQSTGAHLTWITRYINLYQDGRRF